MKQKLNIFNSAFGIKANLKTKELEIQKYWKAIDLVKRINQNKEDKFILHIGPPYANGNIHIGHALNFVLKDITLRFHNLNGKKTIAIPGWDTHGLPIALMVKKQNKEFKDHISFRQECALFAQTQVINQEKQFMRLGTQIDFQTKYLTMSPEYVSQQLNILSKMVRKKLIFQSQKPVYWSWSNETALADTEVIYLNKKSPSVFVLFPLVSFSEWKLNLALLVWTTTPWTLPANQYLAIKKKAKYLILEIPEQEKKIILAKDLFLQLQKKWPLWEKAKIIKTILGEQLLEKTYQHPYLNFKGKIIHSNHVQLDEGTGIVHIAPAHGAEDFALIKDKSKIICMIDKKGFFNDHSSDPALKGLFYLKAEKKIIERIMEKKNLVNTEIIEHQYPHDWRSKKPVIYLLTKQWYLDLKPLKTKIENIISKTKWIPEWGKKRMNKILGIREDWCLSRQRRWGVPLPVFINKEKKVVLKTQFIKHIASLIADKGDNIWWNGKISQLLSSEAIEREQIEDKQNDTLDVWLDSGCSASIVHPEEDVDLVWEGNDQYRGWFNSSIIISAIEDKFKIKKILTHGFVNDAQGRKMSKSLGNVIDPLTVCQDYGADILRLWVITNNYFEDLTLDQKILKRVSSNYVKIRNTIRFLINNLSDFQKKQNYQSELTLFDYIILIKTNILIQKVTEYYRKYQFYLAYQLLNRFFIIDLSTFYFDYGKTILYSQPQDSKERRCIQSVFFHLWKKLLLLWAPFLPHTSEEAYQALSPESKKEKSIFLHSWPTKIDLKINDETEVMFLYKWRFLEEFRREIHQILESALRKKEIKTFKSTTVMFCYDKNYQLFATEKDHLSFCQENAFSSNKTYQEVNKVFSKLIPQVLQTQNLHFFIKIQNILLSNERKGIQIKSGYIQIQEKKGLFCEHCNWKLIDKNYQYCKSCQWVKD